MNWTAILIFAAIFAVFLLMKQTGQISVKDAVEQLKKGALVIDVRSSGEFAAGHLPAAVSIPLDEIETAVPKRVNDKTQPLLLHCASGMRSGIAVRKLKALGYVNAFNLGSYSRAESILWQCN